MEGTVWERTDCSRAFFAAEFEISVHINVYYGRVVLFLEIEIDSAVPSRTLEARIIVVSDWTTRGLKVGRQHRIFSVSGRSTRNVFQSGTVEDVTCICRNISVLSIQGSNAEVLNGFDDHQEPILLMKGS